MGAQHVHAPGLAESFGSLTRTETKRSGLSGMQSARTVEIVQENLLLSRGYWSVPGLRASLSAAFGSGEWARRCTAAHAAPLRVPVPAPASL